MSNNSPVPQVATVRRKIGSNRGKARLWLEGNCLSENGWQHGQRFASPEWGVGFVAYHKDPEGARKVAGTPERPIVDTNTDKLAKSLGGAKLVSVTISPSHIIITPIK